MNARIERAMNSENLGARTMQNGALDQKISGLEALKGKMVILGDSREFPEIFGMVGESWHQRQGLLQSLENF
jgi:hypothetical protein